MVWLKGVVMFCLKRPFSVVFVINGASCARREYLNRAMRLKRN